MRQKFDYYFKALLNSYHIRLWLANLVCGLLPDFISGVIRARVYRLAGFKIGSGCFIIGNLDLISGQPQFYDKLEIGANAVIGNRVTINLDGNVTLEENVSIGPFVRIYTGTHNIGPGSNRRQVELVVKPVVIERGSWVGMCSIILPGVRIGHGSIVAGGAVVTKDVPPNSYVEGNPAKVVQTLPWGDE
ncbi:MAG: acyltransferase [Chloroflexota bacterium]|nr:acyltransferase [Chloroflexota bacterium]